MAMHAASRYYYAAVIIHHNRKDKQGLPEVIYFQRELEDDVPRADEVKNETVP